MLSGSSGEWFELKATYVGAGQSGLLTNLDTNNRMGDETRHPWSGFSSALDLKLFKSLKLPFLGPVTTDQSLFEESRLNNLQTNKTGRQIVPKQNLTAQKQVATVKNNFDEYKKTQFNTKTKSNQPNELNVPKDFCN